MDEADQRISEKTVSRSTARAGASTSLQNIQNNIQNLENLQDLICFLCSRDKEVILQSPKRISILEANAKLTIRQDYIAFLQETYLSGNEHVRLKKVTG